MKKCHGMSCQDWHSSILAQPIGLSYGTQHYLRLPALMVFKIYVKYNNLPVHSLVFCMVGDILSFQIILS